MISRILILMIFLTGISQSSSLMLNMNSFEFDFFSFCMENEESESDVKEEVFQDENYIEVSKFGFLTLATELNSFYLNIKDRIPMSFCISPETPPPDLV